MKFNLKNCKWWCNEVETFVLHQLMISGVQTKSGKKKVIVTSICFWIEHFSRLFFFQWSSRLVYRVKNLLMF